MALPKTTDQWVVTNNTGFDDIKLQTSVPLPPLGDSECLVRIEAVSLNYRDAAIPNNAYALPTHLPIIPTSDASCTILATGRSVTTLSPGDRVLTITTQSHLTGPITPQTMKTALGGDIDGTLRRHAIFPATGLVKLPPSLSLEEGSCLGGAAVTAWNCLFGPGSVYGRGVRPGDVVLTQGTGAVSLWAVQLAVAAGAVVVGTTSSKTKAGRLRGLGVRHVVDYKEDEGWGETLRGLVGGEGVDLVVDVGGAGTLGQSLKAVRLEGTVALVGFLSGLETKGPQLMEAIVRATNVRGILAGPRTMYEDLVKAVEALGIRPVMDQRVFGFEEAVEALKYMWEQKHVGKVVIRVS